MPEETKKPYLSKTINLSALGFILSAVALYYPNAGGVGQWVADNGPMLGMAWGVLGIIFRVVSKGKIVLFD